MKHPNITTLGALRAAQYPLLSVKDEVRQNLIKYIAEGKNAFPGILGYENTVIPDVERALLSRHNILFLGLRGQAKTRMAREMVQLLNEWIPIIEGSEVNDHPYKPISHYGRQLVAQKGDDTPIAWLHRSERYGEKLATPDVSVADLIGDIDPIKAANLKLSFADERALHYGIIPRSHRGIFVINELPDLQARIQVSLFNILQEGDIQIRGFKMQLPLDILFVFTANPEDYTNRGSIVTPLKDRIQSQIITHYPKDITTSTAITEQEAKVLPEQAAKITAHELCSLLIEQIAMEARKSEYVDPKSGVSARLTISAKELLMSTAELRTLKNGDLTTHIRIADFTGIIPAITGKIELVYEGEQEGTLNVAYRLLGLALRAIFLRYFPHPESFKKQGKDKNKAKTNPYTPIIEWFGAGNDLALIQHLPDSDYRNARYEVDGLHAAVKKVFPHETAENTALLMELVLHGLAELSLISKKGIDTGAYTFKDILGSMLILNDSEEEGY